MIVFAWIKQTSSATIVTKKIIFFVTVSNRNKKIRKKSRIDRRNLDRVDQKNWFYSSYVRDVNIHDRKKIDAFTNHDELRCYQKFHFSIENEEIWHQWILRFSVEIYNFRWYYSAHVFESYFVNRDRWLNELCKFRLSWFHRDEHDKHRIDIEIILINELNVTSTR